MDKATQIRKVLDKSGLLRSEDSQILGRIVSAAHWKELDKNDLLFRQGERASRLFGIVYGRISLQSTSIEGKELEVRELWPGEIFGAVEIFDFGSRRYDAVALTSAALFALDRADLFSCMQSSPELCFGMARLLCQDIREQSTALELQAMHPLPIQLAFQLSRLSDREENAENGCIGGLGISQFDLARKVGAHRQSVNRQLRLWEKNGWVKLGRERIHILNRAALSELLPADLGNWAEGGGWPISDETEMAASTRGVVLGRRTRKAEQSRTVGIMAVEATDYSKFLESDALGTLKRLRSGLGAIDKAVSNGGGRTVAHLGDRVLAEFPTAAQAFEAAMELSSKLRGFTYAGGRVETQLFRIGVHRGEVPAGEAEFLSEAVNVAIRLTGIATSGGVLLSQQTLDGIEKTPKLEIQFLGSHELENVSYPVRVYSARPLPLGARTFLLFKSMLPLRYRLAALCILVLAVGAALWFAGGKFDAGNALETTWTESVAILPFFVAEGDDSTTYLSSGLSEEIRNLLAMIPSLKVTGQPSSLLIGGKNMEAGDVGEALGVNSVLRGTVNKDGERFLITVRLLDVSDGTTIWAGNYDCGLAGLFLVQQEVAESIANALQLGPGHLPERRRPASNARAYAAYLKARASYNLFELRAAEALLKEAVALDPGFSQAWELLAATYWRLSGETIGAAEGQMLTYRAATRALQIDPDLVFAQALQTAGDIDNWSYLIELEALESAVQKLPGHSELLNALSFDLVVLGYFEQAVQVSRRSLSLDPLSLIAHNRHADALIATGRIKEATAILENAADLGNPYAWWNLAVLNLTEGQDEAALDYFQEYFGNAGAGGYAQLERLVKATSEPGTGRAYLDRVIPQLEAEAVGDDDYEWRLNLRMWYLYRGLLDPYFDFILDSHPESSQWSDSETLIQYGSIYRNLGFTAHARYLEVAQQAGLMAAWETRGPPDYCQRKAGRWVCE